MDFSVGILNHEEFLEIHRKSKEDFKSVPTPAITSINIKILDIKFIVIDKDFLPQDPDKEKMFVSLLLEHELAEVDYYKQNPDFYNSTLEKIKRKEAGDLDAHKYALGVELELAQELGILEEYQNHWERWLNKELSEEPGEKIKEAIFERLQLRKEVLAGIKKEPEGDIHKELRR